MITPIQYIHQFNRRSPQQSPLEFQEMRINVYRQISPSRNACKRVQLYMSLIAFVIIIICIVIYVLADISRKNHQLQQSAPSSHLRRQNQYVLQSQILTQMAKEKSAQLQTKSKPKLSIHINTPESIPDLNALILALKSKFKVCVILNTSEEEIEFNQGVKGIVEGTQVFRCKTLEGEVAIIRQLNPKVHVETDERIIKTLKPYLNLILTTHSSSSDIEDSKNIIKSKDLRELLKSIPTLQL